MDGDNMSERDEINTLDGVEWQRSMASYMNVFPDVLNGLADALDEVDLSRLEDKKQREIKNKINAVRQLARLPVPSAPISDGGVAKAIGKHGAELGRMNKIQFVGGKVLNNCMGIALFLDPDQLSEYMARGPVRIPPLWIVPNGHGHVINHGHTLSGTATATDAGHTHTGTTDSHVHTLNLHTHAIANIPVYTGQNGTGCLLGYANGTSATPYPLNTEGNTATFTTASGEASISVNISGVNVDNLVGVSGEEELTIELVEPT